MAEAFRSMDYGHLVAVEDTPGIINVDQLLEEIQHSVATSTEFDDDAGAKFNHAELDAIMTRDQFRHLALTDLDRSFVQKKYVEIVLKTWLDESLEKVFADRNPKDLPRLLNHLDKFRTFQDVYNSKIEMPLLFQWVGGKSLDLILNQPRLFATVNTEDLTTDFVDQFKRQSLHQLVISCYNSTRQLEWVKGLENLVAFLKQQPERSAIFKDDFLKSNVEKQEISGQHLVQAIIHNVTLFQHLEDDPSNRFKTLTELLEDDDWTSNFEWLVKEVCRRLMLPRVTLKKENVGGRKIVLVEGSLIYISEILAELEDMMVSAEEIHFVGQSVVHVDCSLDQEKWHAKNIAVVTDQLFVNKTAVWDVSGQSGQQVQKHARSGKRPGEDGLAGKPGFPGESGGNVFIICNEIINGQQWTVISNGGRGGDGQTGGDGGDGTDRVVPQVMTLTEFRQLLPKYYQLFNCGYKSMEQAIELLKQKANPSNVSDMASTSVVTIHSTRNTLFFQSETHDGGQIHVSLWGRNLLVLWQVKRNSEIGMMGGRGGHGGQGGQGGYGGTVTIRKVDGTPLVIPGLMIGREPQNNYISIGADGHPGLDGDPGIDGKPGRQIRSHGDFGVIDNMANTNSSTWKRGRNFFGFDTVEFFDVEYLDKNSNAIPIDKPSIMSNLDGQQDIRLAVLVPIQHQQSMRTTEGLANNTVHQTNQDRKEAIHRKAITFQSLNRHLARLVQRDRKHSELIPLPQRSSSMTGFIEREQQRQSLSSNTYSLLDSHENIMAITFHRPVYRFRPLYSAQHLKTQQQITRQTDRDRLETATTLLHQDLESQLKFFDLVDRVPLDNWIQIAQQQSMTTSNENDGKELSRHLKIRDTVEGKHSLIHAALGHRHQQRATTTADNNGSYACDSEPEAVRKLLILTSKQPFFQEMILRLVVDDPDEALKELRQVRIDYLKQIRDQFWQSFRDHWPELEKEMAKVKNYHQLDTGRLDADQKWPNFDLNNKIIHYLRCFLKNDDFQQPTDDPVSAGFVINVFQNESEQLKEIINKLNHLDDEYSIQKPNPSTAILTEIKVERVEELMMQRHLDLPELALLCKDDGKIYYVYNELAPKANDGCDMGTIRFHRQINTCPVGRTSSTEEIFLLRRADGQWKRMEIDPHIREYCRCRYVQTLAFRSSITIRPYVADNGMMADVVFLKNKLTTYQQLIDCLKARCSNDAFQKASLALKWIDPKYGSTPHHLFSLILNKIPGTQHPNGKPTTQSDLDDKFVDDLCQLVDRVINYNHRGIDPVFYLHVVANLNSCWWKYEFLLMDMEDAMKFVLRQRERTKWRKNIFRLNERIVSILADRLFVASDPTSISIDREKLGQTLEMLASQLSMFPADVDRLGQLSINDWFFELKSFVWEKKIDRLFTNANVPADQKKEAVHMLLELESNKGQIVCLAQLEAETNDWRSVYNQIKNIFVADGHSSTRSSNWDLLNGAGLAERSADFIVAAIEKERGGNTSLLSDLNLKTNTGEWADEERLFGHPKRPQGECLARVLYAYISAIQLRMNVTVRHTQRVAIVTLLANSNNSLAQVATGEGKSLIVAALAIYRVLYNSHSKVDIVTSNSVLAKRDASLSTDCGGLSDIYQIFNVSVAHNGCQIEADRIRAYDSSVVYGALADFQRDHLLDKFYGRNIRGDRFFDFIIVDEVDCMLLDRGTNTLYLSHDIPGMELLESLYVFIWVKIRTTTKSLKQIKCDVLYDIYGAITLDELDQIHTPLKADHEKKRHLWSHLVDKKIIDQNGRFLIEKNSTYKELTEEKLNYPADPELNPKLIYFFRNVAERKRHIRVPKSLEDFVDRHLDEFLDNALRALIFKSEENYVVDFDRTITDGANVDPKIIIIDPDTGTDQISSQWDGGLHQFLQLKEGCRLTLQSLKSVFISNVTFIKRYDKLAGLTGTLGSVSERQFLKEMYHCDYFSVLTAHQKRMTIKPAMVVKTHTKWIDTLIEDTHQTIAIENRSLVIFCSSIHQVKLIEHELKHSGRLPVSTSYHLYTRDYEEFKFTGSENRLDVGQVIIATNLAGRGTDIKISDQLRKNGGLHICLTYLPDNIRIEEQALGRAGRKGDPGSGILIILSSPSEMDGQMSIQEDDSEDLRFMWGIGKIFELKVERDRQEMVRISALRKEFDKNLNEEKLLEQMWNSIVKKKKEMSSESHKYDKQVIDLVCQCLLDCWALWLDAIGSNQLMMQSESFNNLSDCLDQMLIDKLPTGGNLISDLSWMGTARRIALVKHWITKQSPIKTDHELHKLLTAILDGVIDSDDSWFYPSAIYYTTYLLIKNGALGGYFNTRIVRLLRTVESLLDQHIDMHMGFSSVVGQIREDQKHLLCPVESYKRQKNNVIRLLHCFVISVRSLLGSTVSVASLQQETGIPDKNRAHKIFNRLIELKCIVKCRVHEPDTVPHYLQTVNKVANDYDIDSLSLKRFLSDYLDYHQGQLTEDELEMKLEQTDMIRCTRKSLWKYLVECKALILPSPSGHPTVDQVNSVTLVKYGKVVLYDPSPLAIKGLLDGTEKIEDYQYAMINLDVMEQVDLSIFGLLKGPNGLIPTGIASESERKKVWQELIVQKFICPDGRLSPSYKLDQIFHYPDCPIYADAVDDLVRRTYAAELIRRQWLGQCDDVEYRMKIIAVLPPEPYRDLLSDLQAGHILSGYHVNDDRSIRFVEVISSLSMFTEDTERIVDFLMRHQARMATFDKPTVTLTSIQSIVRRGNQQNAIVDQQDSSVSTDTDVHLLHLNGLDHLIDMSEDTNSPKLWMRCGAIIAVAMTLLATGISLTMFNQLHPIDPIGPTIGKMFYEVGKTLMAPLMVRSVMEIYFIVSSLKSSQQMRWSDYHRHWFRKPIDFANNPICNYASNVVNRLIRGSMTFSRGFRPNESTENEVSNEPLTTGQHSVVRIQLSNIPTSSSSSVNRYLLSVGLLNGLAQSQIKEQLFVLCHQWHTDMLKNIGETISFECGRQEMRDVLFQIHITCGEANTRHLVVDELILLVAYRWTIESQLLIRRLVDKASLELQKNINRMALRTENGKFADMMVEKVINLLRDVQSNGALRMNEMIRSHLAGMPLFLQTKLSNIMRCWTRFDSDDQEEIELSKNHFLMPEAEGRRAQMEQVLLSKMSQVVADRVAFFKEHMKQAIEHCFDFVIPAKLNSNAANTFVGLQDSYSENHLKQHLNTERPGRQLTESSPLPVASQGQQADVSKTRRIEICIEMVKKTKDPALLAALLRDGDGQPAEIVLDDLFFQIGLEIAFNSIQPNNENKLRRSLVLRENCLQVAEVLEDENSPVYRDVRLRWRKEARQLCPFQEYPIDDCGCLLGQEGDCPLRGLSEYPGLTEFVDKEMGGRGLVDNFHLMRKNFLSVGDNKSLVWLNIRTFFLPVVKRIVDREKRKELIDSAEQHFRNYAVTTKPDGDPQTAIISDDDLTEIKCRFRLCIS